LIVAGGVDRIDLLNREFSWYEKPLRLDGKGWNWAGADVGMGRSLPDHYIWSDAPSKLSSLEINLIEACHGILEGKERMPGA